MKRLNPSPAAGPIAALALLKGLLLLLAAVVLLGLLHRDLAQVISGWLTLLHINTQTRLAHGLLLQLRAIDQGRLVQIAAGSFLYAGLLLAEGAGLYLRKRWAQYLTLGATAALVPFEFYGFQNHSRGVQLAIVAANLALIGYLVAWVRKNPYFTSAFSRSRGVEASS